MPEPTLEQIAEWPWMRPPMRNSAEGACVVLAREIIALREQVATNDAQIDRRLCALENRRDVDGESAARDLRVRLEGVRVARDAAIARAEQAERRRFEWQETARQASEERHQAVTDREFVQRGVAKITTERDEARAERDAAVEALKRLASTEAFEGALTVDDMGTLEWAAEHQEDSDA